MKVVNEQRYLLEHNKDKKDYEGDIQAGFLKKTGSYETKNEIIDIYRDPYGKSIYVAKLKDKENE